MPSELIDCHGLLLSKFSGPSRPSAFFQEKSAQTMQKKQPNLMVAKNIFTPRDFQGFQQLSSNMFHSFIQHPAQKYNTFLSCSIP